MSPCFRKWVSGDCGYFLAFVCDASDFSLGALSLFLLCVCVRACMWLSCVLLRRLKVVCEKIGLPAPKRPEPFYSFFPIYSPTKIPDENAGFDMGDDNKLRQIFIKDGKLRFQMSAVLRPGRFLGSHYIAFTLPARTFIITMDRVREGARTARKNKKIAALEKELSEKEDEDSSGTFSVEKAAAASAASDKREGGRLKKLFRKNKMPKPGKSFFSRFVEGYTLVDREGDTKSEQLANDITSYFGGLGSSNATIDGDVDENDATSVKVADE